MHGPLRKSYASKLAPRAGSGCALLAALGFQPVSPASSALGRLRLLPGLGGAPAARGQPAYGLAWRLLRNQVAHVRGGPGSATPTRLQPTTR